MLIDAAESPVPVQHSQSGAAEAASARLDGQRSGQRTVPEHSASFQVNFEMVLDFEIGFYGNSTFTSTSLESQPKPGQMKSHFYGPFRGTTPCISPLIDFLQLFFHILFTQRRATLLLVPLLGLQYILTPFRPGKNHPYEATYESKYANVCQEM